MDYGTKMKKASPVLSECAQKAENVAVEHG